MKILMPVLFAFIALPLLGQKMKSGVAPFDHKDKYMISITFKGDIAPFLQKLKTDFGPGQKYDDNGDGYPGIRWFGIGEPEWDNKRIIIQLYWISMEEKTIVLISCLDEAGDDILIPDSDMERNARKYFKKKL